MCVASRRRGAAWFNDPRWRPGSRPRGRTNGRARLSGGGARFDADASRLIAGASDGHVYVQDANRNVTTLRVRAHVDDVNAVAWADLRGDANVLYSGSDDATVKVWDARTAGFEESDGAAGGVGGSSYARSLLSRRRFGRRDVFLVVARRNRAACVLSGPGAGVRTDSRGDGRYLISNCKDQTVKLWDVRKMVEPSAVERGERRDPRARNWDYRRTSFPGGGWRPRGPDDVSVQTYRGHVVDQTLIRTYFGPRGRRGRDPACTGSATVASSFRTSLA